MRMITGKSKLLIGAVVVALSFQACSDSDDNSKQDSVEVADTTQTLLQTDKDIYTSWDDFYSQEDASFSIDSFLVTDSIKGELFTQSFTPDKQFYDIFGPLLVYNNDSSVFIDAYSTTWIVEKGKDGQRYAREGEADQEVTIVNTRTNTRTRLLFCGPSCIVQKAFWYNDDIVGIMGLMTEYADEYYKPTIWFVNIHNGITIPYQYHSNISLMHADDFMKKHMESKGIKMQY